jgi:HD-GYP domain-containing protein (c-di-GMP phosphodiesterase class II)
MTPRDPEQTTEQGTLTQEPESAGSPDVSTDATASPQAQTPEPQSAAASPVESSHVEINTSWLETGQNLQFPIFDKSGVLLIAQGAVVTSRFKEILTLRGTHKVMVSRSDVKAMRATVEKKRDEPKKMELDSDVVEKLDDLIEAGQLFVEDAGEKFKDRLENRGTTRYDEEQREELVVKHTETCSLLDDMIRAAAHGESLNGGDIATVVSDYLSHLTLDSDCVLDVTTNAREFATLAQQSLQSAILGMALAIEMGRDEATVRLIGLSGLLYNWGMVYVPRELREAKRILTTIEFLEVAKHPIYTANMLQRVWGIPPQVALICYQIRECPNGSGYPRGRTHNSIHPCAAILKVADAFIAMTSPRPYRQPMHPVAALECLMHQASKKIVDPATVRALLMVVSQFPIGTYVQLSDGSKAQVVRRNAEKYWMPIVQLLEKGDQTRVDPGHDANTFDPSEKGLKIVQIFPKPGQKQLNFDPDLLVLKRSKPELSKHGRLLNAGDTPH